eukprot:230100-Amphidinium_carterae.1
MSAVLRVEQQHYDCPMSGVYPPSPLSVKPFTFPTITSHRDVSASAMLFAILTSQNASHNHYFVPQAMKN